MLELMQTESVPDCHLITKERILIEAHKIILFKSPFLRALITSVSCDQGKCPVQETVTLILPDISYRHIDPIIQYFYTGALVFPASEKSVICNLLFRLLRISPHREKKVNRALERILHDGDDRVAVFMRQVEDICYPDVSQPDQLNKQHQGHQESQERNKKSDDDQKEGEGQQQITELLACMLDEVEELNQNNQVLYSGNLEEGFNKQKQQETPLMLQPSLSSRTETNNASASGFRSSSKSTPEAPPSPVLRENPIFSPEEGEKEQESPKLKARNTRLRIKLGSEIFHIEDIRKGINNQKKARVSLPRNIKTDMKCLTCRYKVKGSDFKQHLVRKHLHHLWTEVGPNEIKCQDCNFVAVSRMKLIWHLAIEHGQLEIKMTENNLTISDYGAAIVSNTSWEFDSPRNHIQRTLDNQSAGVSETA